MPAKIPAPLVTVTAEKINGRPLYLVHEIGSDDVIINFRKAAEARAWAHATNRSRIADAAYEVEVARPRRIRAALAYLERRAARLPAPVQLGLSF